MGKDWTSEGLLSLVPDKWKPLLVGVVSPLPPSGLVPLVPSFKRIPRDVCYIGDTIYRIGGGPGEMVHALEYHRGASARKRIGIPLQRPVGDCIKVRRLPARARDELFTHRICTARARAIARADLECIADVHAAESRRHIVIAIALLIVALLHRERLGQRLATRVTPRLPRACHLCALVPAARPILLEALDVPRTIKLAVVLLAPGLEMVRPCARGLLRPGGGRARLRGGGGRPSAIGARSSAARASAASRQEAQPYRYKASQP